VLNRFCFARKAEATVAFTRKQKSGPRFDQSGDTARAMAQENVAVELSKAEREQTAV
jgi:hypothetical protein